RADARQYLASACRAVSVELQPVALDLVPGRSRELTHEVAYSAVIEVLHLAAASANQVVMVLRAMRETVVEARVVQQHPADDAQFREQPYRAEHGRPAGPPAAMKQVLDAKVARLLQHCRNYGAPRRSHTITAGLEPQADSFKIRHDTSSQSDTVSARVCIGQDGAKRQRFRVRGRRPGFPSAFRV